MSRARVINTKWSGYFSFSNWRELQVCPTVNRQIFKFILKLLGSYYQEHQNFIEASRCYLIISKSYFSYLSSYKLTVNLFNLKRLFRSSAEPRLILNGHLIECRETSVLKLSIDFQGHTDGHWELFWMRAELLHFLTGFKKNADGWSDTWYISCEDHLSAVSCPGPGASQDCCIATEQGMYYLIIKLFWTKELIWGLRSQVSLTTNFHNCRAAAASPCESCTNNSQLVGETAMHDRDYWFLSALYFTKEGSISVGYKIFT